ncbi:alpha-hydroxy acid oxidase [Microbaculum marinum]|uniref:Alpha-hydroxy acid oxidase n=1 Tax=Microbaculum marinum TaxID=1764581 RepID=A0AAW9RVP5_9HYPH
MVCLNVADYRHGARRRLPRGLFEYVDRGTEDETGLAAIRRSLDAVRIVPRVLRDVSGIDLSTRIFGRTLPCPLIVAPTAAAGLLWHDGEVALASAAGAAGLPFCAATQSMTSIEAIRAGAPDADLWFQLYVWQDRDLVGALLERAAAAGATTLVLTVDTPISPKREYNTRNGFAIPIVPSATAAFDVARHPRWTWQVLLRYLRQGGMPTYANYPPEFRTALTRRAVSDRVRLSERVTWEDVEDLRRDWRGRLVLKGVLHVDDARRAADLGADGIVVSAHGGRNLDCAVAPADVLPGIAEAVGEKMTVFADSGIRRGSDVVKLLAMGASAVLLGRSVLFGTAVAGRAGAAHVLAILREEISQCLAFAGQTSIEDLDPGILFRPLPAALAAERQA